MSRTDAGRKEVGSSDLRLGTHFFLLNPTQLDHSIELWVHLALALTHMYWSL